MSPKVSWNYEQLGLWSNRDIRRYAMASEISLAAKSHELTRADFVWIHRQFTIEYFGQMFARIQA